MRISDWSSDVCSSDLNPVGGDLPRISVPLLDEGRPTAFMIFTRKLDRIGESLQPHLLPPFGRDLEVLDAPTHFFTGQDARAVFFLRRRSEEHTSELQSLMRISYAVFCLKKHIDRRTKPTYTL